MRKPNNLNLFIKLIKQVTINIIIYLLALLHTIIFAESCLALSSDSSSISDLKNVHRMQHYKY